MSIFKTMAEISAEQWSRHCEHEFMMFKKLKKAFGDRFDELNFVNYETNQFMKGSELRDCQTGCEILKAQNHHKVFHTDAQQCGCKQFDEQLQFVDKDDKPLSFVDYCITRGDGMELKGTTDDEGKTMRIRNTQQEMAIEKVEFFATKHTQPLCPQNRIAVGSLLASREFSDVKTTQQAVGTSVKKITLEGKHRKLTNGEEAMARPVFQDAIEYWKVKVYRNELLPFGLQQGNGMTPWGNLYCPDKDFRDDYSIEKDPARKIWFIHEMTHVWQYQLGYDVAREGFKVFMHGGYNKGSVYKYDDAKGKKTRLPDFNFEQQAEIISHYYGGKYLKIPKYLPDLKTFFEPVLKDFLKKPKDKYLLPPQGDDDDFSGMHP